MAAIACAWSESRAQSATSWRAASAIRATSQGCGTAAHEHPSHLAHRGDGNDKHAQQPAARIHKQTDRGTEPGHGEEDREETRGHHVLTATRQRVGADASPREGYADGKSTEQCVQADGLGGTWHENRYPGCRVDVPNHLYSYSFATRADWPQQFSDQRVLLDYFRGVAADLGAATGCEQFVKACPDADILVNNMGIFDPKPFEEIPDEEWFHFFETNVMSGLDDVACVAHRTIVIAR